LKKGDKIRLLTSIQAERADKICRLIRSIKVTAAVIELHNLL
jgi:hypothetical protein